MALGQKKDGSTINATVSQNANTGQLTYSFDDPFSMVFNLNNFADAVLTGTTLNDKFNLQSASGMILNGGDGNDIFALTKSAADLNGNILRGGTGIDFVTLGGSGTQVDLTQGSSGIEAVVGRKAFTDVSVTVGLDQLTSSGLTDGGSGRAFAAVIGSTGQVNVLEVGNFKLVGVVDAANHGYTATGDAITGDALTSLLASVTSISSISGNLAAMWAGSTSVPSTETHIANELNAYVFGNGTKSYTIWSDGVVTPTDRTGNVLAPIYHPAAATAVDAPSYDVVDTYDKSGDWASATFKTAVDGSPSLKLDVGTVAGYSAFALKAGVTGEKIIGDNGANGFNWFGLGASGGANQITGSKAGNVFDLQQSTSLQDNLIGGKGFDVVRAATDGTDVDLTANNGSTGKAATGIDAVTGSLKGIQTVEIDMGKLTYVADATGAKTALFEALLGSQDDTLTLTGAGKWAEVATFQANGALPTHASALTGTDVLNQAFAAPSHLAETSLVGHLFEQVNAQGDALRYATIYTDATIQNDLQAPAHPIIG